MPISFTGELPTVGSQAYKYAQEATGSGTYDTKSNTITTPQGKASFPVSSISSSNGASTIDQNITDHNTDMTRMGGATPTTPKTPTGSVADGLKAQGGLSVDEVNASGADVSNYTYDPATKYFMPKKADSGADAYEADKKAINDSFATQIASMDAATMSIISSLRGIYSARIAEQAEANRRELATFDTMNTRYGTTRYAPGVAQGVLTADERVGLDRIRKIAAEEASLIAQAQQSLTDKKYTAFVQQRNDLTELRKERTATLTKLQDRAYEVEKESRARAQKITDDLKVSLNTVLTDSAKNGATSDVIAKISSAKTLAEAVDAAGSYLQGGTGIIGEYNFYKKDATSRGLTPVDFATYQNEDANRKIRVAAASQDPDRILSANEAAALGLPFGTKASDAYGKFATKPATEAQNKDASYAQRTFEANGYINNLEDTVAGMNPVSYYSQITAEPTAFGNAFVSDDIRQLRQAERNFLTAILRRESGAAISATEFATGDKQYFPRPGDDEVTLSQKRQNRETQIKNLAKSAGPALTETLGVPSAGSNLLGSQESAITKIKTFHDASPANADAYDAVVKIAPNATPEEIAEMLQIK